MGNKLRTNEFTSLRTNMSALIRKETLEGEERLAVPVILMVEGVHNGIYYSAEELSKHPQSWNGRPVPIYHPKDAVSGLPISANSPKIKEKRVGGELFNTVWEDGKLKSEAWIDPVKVNKINKDVIERLENDEMLEVSTGLFMDYISESGVWNGESYSEIAINYVPDHLAILPNIEGACSIKDGAGMPRINEGEDKKPISRWHKMTEFFQKGMDIFKANELSHDDIRQQLSNLISVQSDIDPNKNDYVWIRDVYDKFFIYERENDSGVQLFKVGYSIDAEENVALVGEPVEVEEKVEFIPVTNEDDKTNKVNKSIKGDLKMENDRKTKIEALIANEDVGFGEDDREFLEGMDDAQFEKIENMIPKPETKKIEPEATPAPAVNAKPAVAPGTEEPAEEKPATLDELVANASPEMKDMIKSGVALAKEQRTAITEGILKANSGFTAEELASKDLSELKKLAGLARVKTDFTANVGNASPQVNEEDSAPMEAPSMIPKAK